MMHRFECLACHATYGDTDRGGGPYFHACPPLRPDKDGVEKERPNKRDENLQMDRAGNFLGIIAEGDGVNCLTNNKLDEQPWLTKLKSRVPKENEDDFA